MSTRPPLTATAFVELAVRSRLVAAGGEVPVAESVQAPTPTEAAERLIRAGLITRFQAQKLLHGWWQGLAIGPYRLLYPIGRGGVGIVYLARDAGRPSGERTPRLVALKLLSPRRAREEPRTLARFRREMEIGPHIPFHPHLARTLDTGAADGIHFVVMEYVAGSTVRQKVRADGPLGVPLAARTFADVAAGLHAAHLAGFVHRDTKPANVIITPSGRGKLLDFGFALRRGETPPADPSIIGGKGYTLGTVDYLPPEQASDAVAVGGETDVYSLGCSLYFALTGVPPFPTGSTRDKLRAHRVEEPTPIPALNPSVPAGFAALVRWLMAKRPEDRPQSAGVVAAELERWVPPGVPVAARVWYDDAWEQEVVSRVESVWVAEQRTTASDSLPAPQPAKPQSESPA